MKAIVSHEKKPVLKRNHPIPKLDEDYILVKTVAIALNPTDWKHVAFGYSPEGGTVGCDFAGTVEEVGKAVTKSWNKGDRVMGVVHGCNYVRPGDGAFAEYIVAKGDVQMKIPKGMSFEKAATVSLGAITCGQGLYQKALKLNLPTDPIKEEILVLIYGGSTATGSLAIQYAKL
jgi:NADPH:quinone reductase-like Zn-dependent oxidoreductase